jgi:hypothetical protein
MPRLVGAVLGLCAPCAQVPSPRSAALQPDYTSITGSRSDPTSQVILYYHVYCCLYVLVAGRAGLVHVLRETECLAEAWASVCCETDTRGELLGGFRPCRPRVASLRACGNILKSFWSACECAGLHKSAVRSWRPRLPGGVCTKAETSCPDLQARLWYTAQVWVRHTYATLSRALAASVCDVCSGHRPRTRQDGHGYMLVTGSSCAPARLEMH